MWRLLLDEIRPVENPGKPPLKKKYTSLQPVDSGYWVADEIECVEADGNYTTIYLTDGTKQLTTRSLGDFEQLLSPAVFFSLSQKLPAQPQPPEQFFSSRRGNQCTTTSGRQIPVARRKQMEFMERVFQLTGQRNEPPKLVDAPPPRMPSLPGVASSLRAVTGILLLVLVLHGRSAGHVMDFSYPNFNSTNGLQTNVVHHVMQDSDGYIWLGTDSGVSRFDGSRFRPLHHRRRSGWQ